MLDIRKIRENPDAIKYALKARGEVWDAVIDRVLELDVQILALKTTSQSRIAQKNKIVKENGKLYGIKKRLEKTGQNTEEVEAKIAANNRVAKQIDRENNDDIQTLEELNKEYRKTMLSLPNIPDKDLTSEYAESEIIYSTGRMPSFDFQPVHYFELCEKLKMIDSSFGCSNHGINNCFYAGMGAKLEWALLNYFIERNDAAGYTFIQTPQILKEESGELTATFSKGKNESYSDIFRIKMDSWYDGELYLLPSAEDALASLYKDRLLLEQNLPKKYSTCAACFQRGKFEKQTNQMEIFQITAPEKSDEAFEEMVHHAEALAEGLGLHFRTVKLSAWQCPDNKARTYQIETWIPYSNKYETAFTVSNARDFQARRGNIRYRRADGKIDFVHTLNGSGLATSRIFPAIVEQNQRADGSIVVPEVLRKYLGGIEIITK